MGATQQFTAMVSPANATLKNVTWTSSNTAVATVSATGVVRAVGIGNAIITATSAQDPTKKASVSVSVTSAKISVSSVTLNLKTAKLTPNQSIQLTATVNPDNATNKKIVWGSSNTKVASVDANGKLTARALGTATITAASEADRTKKVTVSVSVTSAKVSVSSVTLNLKTTTLAPKQTLQLSATLKPTNATNKKVSWSSSNSAIASVDAKGKVTAKANGTTTITATSADDGTKKAAVKVTVALKSASATPSATSTTSSSTTSSTSSSTSSSATSKPSISDNESSCSWSQSASSTTSSDWYKMSRCQKQNLVLNMLSDLKKSGKVSSSKIAPTSYYVIYINQFISSLDSVAEAFALAQEEYEME
jgi:uncharacterized protein YjdB